MDKKIRDKFDTYIKNFNTDWKQNNLSNPFVFELVSLHGGLMSYLYNAGLIKNIHDYYERFKYFDVICHGWTNENCVRFILIYSPLIGYPEGKFVDWVKASFSGMYSHFVKDEDGGGSITSFFTDDGDDFYLFGSVERVSEAQPMTFDIDVMLHIEQCSFLIQF